jgi:hypothetical protein
MLQLPAKRIKNFSHSFRIRSMPRKLASVFGCFAARLINSAAANRELQIENCEMGKEISDCSRRPARIAVMPPRGNVVRTQRRLLTQLLRQA